MTKTVLEQLSDFIASAGKFRNRNAWLEDDLMKVYVRKASHLIGSKIESCLDIATVEVFEQKQGTWTNFIWKAHDLNPWKHTYIENVLNPHLHKWLSKNKFILSDDEISFYLPTMVVA